MIRDWLAEVGRTDEKLPPGSFMDWSLPLDTGANDRMVVIDKPALDASLAGEADPAVLSTSALGRGKDFKPIAIDAAADVVRRVRPAAELWNVELRLVPSFESLPQAIRDEIADTYGEDERPRAVLKGNAVYLVADQHASESELETTIVHEIQGHVGVRRLYGPKITQELNRLFLAIGANSGIQRIAEARDIKDLGGYAKALEKSSLDDDVRIRVMMEEVLSHIAQDPKFSDRVKAIVGMVRDLLRRSGLVKLAEFGETDLLYILSQSRSALTRVGPEVSGAPLVLARGYTDDERAFFASMGIDTEENANAENSQPGRASGRQDAEAITGGTAATGVRGKRVSASVFRGSAEPLRAQDFDPERLGRNTGHPSAAAGVWFASDKADAATYGEPGEHTLTLERPAVFTSDSVPAFASNREARAWAQRLQAQGFDGAVFDYSDVGGPKHYVAFAPEQVIVSGAKGPRYSILSEGDATSLRYTESGGITMQDLRAVTQPVLDKLTGRSVQLVKSAKELPPAIRKDMRSRGIGQWQVEGVFHEGNIYLVADNLATPDRALEILAHEATHYGLRGMLGRGIDPVLMDIARKNPEASAYACRYVESFSTEKSPVPLVIGLEEYLAHMNESQRRKLTGWDRLVAAVRKFLRARGFVCEWTDNDVAYLAHRALNFWRNRNIPREEWGDGVVYQAPRHRARTR